MKIQDPVFTTHAVRKARIAQIASLASNAFVNHSIQTIHEDGIFRHYKCSTNGSLIFHFNVTTFPGRLVVTGDIGDLIAERCEDMFQWTPGALGSIDYFEEKIVAPRINRSWDADVTRAWIEEARVDFDDDDGISEKLDAVARCIDDGEQFVNQEIYESGLMDGCEFPDLTIWDSRFLWCREALLWFFKKRENTAPKDAAT